MNRRVKLEPDFSNGDYDSCNNSNEINGDGRSQSRSSERSSTSDRQHKSSVDNKTCRVCGDRALSINFNVVTCESCKAFFRRNALKPKEFRCPFNGSCDITTASRKFCKRCRLRKCFDVGMMKEWIMTEEARLQKRQLIETNREKRRRLFVVTSPTKLRRKSSKIEIFDSPPATSSSQSSDERQLDTPIFFNGSSTPTGAGLLMIEGAVDRTFAHSETTGPASQGSSSSSTADSITIPKSVLLTLINRCQQNSQQNACLRCPPPPILNRALRLYETGGLDNNFELDDDSSKCVCSCACGAASSPSSNSSSGFGSKTDEPSLITTIPALDDASSASSTSTFGRIDGDRLVDSSSIGSTVAVGVPIFSDVNALNSYRWQELLSSRRFLDNLATELGYGGVEGRQQQHTRFVINDPIVGVKTTHAYIGRIIEMSKSLTTFRNLATRDQVALLQGGMSELMMIQSAINYNHEIDGWHPFGRNQPYLMKVEFLNSLFRADLFHQHVNFVRSFAPQLSANEALMQNLAAIRLFEPSRPGVVDKEGVLTQQQYYYGLMKGYLLSMYGPQEGLRIYGEMKNRLDWLRNCIDQMQPTYHLELSTHDLSPLMCELLL